MSAAAPVAPSPAASPEAAVARLFECYSARLLGFCQRRLGTREEAEDALQQTFLRAFGAIRGGTVPAAEAPWLYRIAENVCYDRLRAASARGRHEALRDVDSLGEELAAPAAEDPRIDGLFEALAQLSGGQRRALVLRELHGLSYREIGKELELSQSAVETLLFRARRSLARRLEAQRTAVRARASEALSALSALKGLLGGAAAAKLAAIGLTAVAVGALAGPPALQRLREEPQPERDAPRPTQVVAPVAPARTPAIGRSAPARARRAPDRALSPAADARRHESAAAAEHPRAARSDAMPASEGPAQQPALPAAGPPPTAPAVPGLPEAPAPPLSPTPTAPTLPPPPEAPPLPQPPQVQAPDTGVQLPPPEQVVETVEQTVDGATSGLPSLP